MPRPITEYRSISAKTYTHFKRSHPSFSDITFADFKLILSTYNELLSDYILETGKKLKLPYGFGEMSVDKYKQKAFRIFEGERKMNLAIDWKKTMQLGKRVYLLNSHTDGYRFRWKWFKRTARFEFSQSFHFKPARVISRKLAKYLKADNQYAQIYREWKTSQM